MPTETWHVDVSVTCDACKGRLSWCSEGGGPLVWECPECGATVCDGCLEDWDGCEGHVDPDGDAWIEVGRDVDCSAFDGEVAQND